ncbi:hypothetical protein BFP70_07665 [Thioclava sp. SK-1]|uniref:cobalamin biosynthesis protein n=1 Tax=Thioclava sp. SK-1 TaxID=1889770 RepID=UPI000824EB42|nr:cobalamin biosynthesis protein [Thioclava sp. SK-1]OCX65992.1 hypothetical protein BFP70_07665 [Thioclava sp. SK-1]
MRVAGIGFNTQATSQTMARAIAGLYAQYGPIDGIATATQKADALLSLLGKTDPRAVMAVSVEGVVTPGYSAHSQARYGTGSVSQAAALVAARHFGPAQLTVQCIRYGTVVLAVAETVPEIHKTDGPKGPDHGSEGETQ